MAHKNRKQRRQANQLAQQAKERIQKAHLEAAGAVPQAATAVTPVKQRAGSDRRDRTQAILEVGLATGGEVALYLGVHLKTVERWRKQYRLPCMRIGGRIRYKLQDVAYWASARKEGE